jgi:hypothetical protein
MQQSPVYPFVWLLFYFICDCAFLMNRRSFIKSITAILGTALGVNAADSVGKQRYLTFGAKHINATLGKHKIRVVVNYAVTRGDIVKIQNGSVVKYATGINVHPIGICLQDGIVSINNYGDES